MRKHLIPLAGLAVVLLAVVGCQRAPAPESSSGLNYAWRTTIPVDTAVYTLRGTVANDVDSLVRQTQRAEAQTYSAEGVSYGTYAGAEFNGKGMVRFMVAESDSPLAPVGSTVILKFDDTKGVMLLPGDGLTVKCRAQFEPLAAVVNRQPFVEAAGVWELDYCRLTTPVVSVTGP
jgi:hypothetical protein